MPTVPTPFIGGSGGPPAERPGAESIEPPFVVDPNEKSPDVAAPPAPPEAHEPASGPGPAVGAEPASAGDVSEPPEPAPSEGEVRIDEVFRESSPGVEPESEAPSPVPPPGAETVTDEASETTEVGEAELPDFLMGADAVGPDLEAPEPDRADEVTARARELLRGKHGDRIRKLAAELGPAADDETISRVFAAGYLAAKREQQE